MRGLRASLAILVLGPGLARAGLPEDAAAAEAAGRAEEADGLWQRAAEAEPTLARFEAWGRARSRRGDLAGTIGVYEQLVARLPDEPRGEYLLALALRKSGRNGDAATRYRSYIARRPDDPDAQYGLAEALKAAGDDAGARVAYETYVAQERRPSEAAWVAKARAEIERLGPAAPATPVSAEPVSAAGVLPASAPVEAPTSAPVLPAASDADRLFAEKHFAQAQQAYTEGLAAQPDAVTLHYRLAVAAAAAGDVATAERQAAIVVRLDPGNNGAYDLAVMARARRGAADATPTAAEAAQALREGRYRTAAELAADALDAAPRSEATGALAWTRGRALLALGRSAEALTALRVAAAAGERPPALLLDLGEAAAAAEEGEAARLYLRAAAEGLPDHHPTARRARARLAELGTTAGGGNR